MTDVAAAGDSGGRGSSVELLELLLLLLGEACSCSHMELQNGL
jgi:hypothetical protein